MLTRFLEWKKVRVLLTYAVYLIAAMFLQSLLFSKLSFFGYKGFVLPAAAVAAGIYLGGVKGAVFGLVLGLCADMSYAETTVLYTVLMPAIGFGAGFAAEFYINKGFFAYMIFAALALLGTGFMQMLVSAVIYGSSLLSGAVTALMQTLLSLIPAAVLYLPFMNRV